MVTIYLEILIFLWNKYKEFFVYRLQEQQNDLEKLLNKNKNKKVVLWGASLFLEKFLNDNIDKQYNIIGIIDKNPDKQGLKIGNYRIYSPEELKHQKIDTVIITITNNIDNIFSNIKEEILKNYRRVKVKRLKSQKKMYTFLEKFLALNILNILKKIQTNKAVKEKNFISLNDMQKNPEYLQVDKEHNYLNILLNKSEFSYTAKIINDNFYICWGLLLNLSNIDTVVYAYKNNKPIIFIEDGFLRSADTFANRQCPVEFKKGISFTIDYLSPYFDATSPTYLELMLNDKSLIITQEEKERARKCINKIVEKHLTKYNHQPIYEPKIGREGVKKVLVVDQSFGDMSIKKGLANSNTFKKMLKAAIKENPNADIIVKTHPDTMAGTKSGYYQKIKERGNIYLQTEPINPISLIKYVDKVYVCTTQFGFEALLCGKEVHTFGMPFYAGWGLTIDNKKCKRRTNSRTLEEIFYITYILYSKYVNPIKQSECQIEDAIDYLLDLRKKYIGY